MSGGVGPCSDISLPKDENIPQNINMRKPQQQQQNRGFFTFRQLNILAIIIILSSSGMISLEDFSFVLFSLFYIFFLSKFSFPLISPKTNPPVFNNNIILNIYVSIGAIIGLFLPIAYIFQGIYEGDKEGIKTATPHVFLLASQVFMEGVTFTDNFSIPIRVFVPVFYNSRRIFTIMEWLRSEIEKVDQEYGGNIRRVYMGRGLAAANLVFWCFNLFGFLLPVYLPKAFKIYYSGNKLKD